MTRLEILQLVVARARSNGFELRRWYTARLGLPWISADAAVTLLDSQRRYYALLFSHEFASTFWKPGADITFEVPAQSFPSRMPDGSQRTIQRKPFIRRSARPDAWRYHLKQMALAEEPLRYLRKYLHIEEQLDPEPEAPAPGRGRGKRTGAISAKAGAGAGERPGGANAQTTKSAAKKTAPQRPLPAGPPAFLKRPYNGSL